jgi:hypothetical protein
MRLHMVSRRYYSASHISLRVVHVVGDAMKTTGNGGWWKMVANGWWLVCSY